MCKNQNYNKRSLIATLVVLAVCLVIVTGSTFSLFTSSTGVNIAVTAANVEMVATIDDASLVLSSMGKVLESKTTFENGGTAKFNDKLTGLNLTYITPGDMATFTINLVNSSNVNIQYRVTWKLANAEGDENDLAQYLNVTVDGKQIGLNAPTSEWTLWEPSNNAEDMTKSIKVSVEFPTNLWENETDEVRYANYRELMNDIANIEFAVEAVQGNGTYAFTAFVNSEAGLQNAINAGATHIVLTAPIELTKNLQIGASMQGKSGGAAETPVVDGILIDLNDFAITAAEGVDAGIANAETVTFINGAIAVDISNSGDLSAVNVKFDSTVTNEDENASFTDTNSTGNLVVAEYYDIDGVTYYYDSKTKQQVLYLVPSDYEDDTVEVAEGTYAIGNYAFAYNNNVKTVILADSVRDLGRGFDSSAVEKVVLNQGLTTISARAFKSTPNLKEVVISSTVTTIADNAFQKSGIKTITIPANVKTVGETAFGSSAIETVIFEGNTNIEGYAFRGCPNLRTVYLNGMDVNFVASRLNGRNNCWFCNGESNNPNTSDITFYVKTNVIKDRVLTAMGAEKDNTPVIVEMTNENGYDVDENGIAHVYTAEALKAALADGKNVVMACDITVAATAGGYGPVGITVDGQTLDGNGHTLTVTGAGSTWACAIYVKGGNIQNIVVAGAMRGIFTGGTTADINLNNVSFKNVVYTYNSDAGNKEYGVYATDCTFNGWTSFSNCHKEVVFTNCTFTKGSGYEFCRPYNAVVFNNCNFTEGYVLDTSSSSSIVLNNCTYGNTAITIQNALALNLNGKAFVSALNNTSINGINYVAGGYHVDANGVAYVSTADALVAALEAKYDVAFLCDIKIEPASMSNAYGATGINVKYGQTIDGNGYTLNIKGAGGTWDSGINTTGGIIKNLTVTGSFRGIFVNHTSTHSEKVVLENVTITGTTYTISCDQGLNQGLVANNCTFNGWTSFAATIGSVEFNNCIFGEGNGYAYCRPYNATKFVNCTFAEGYKLDTSKVSGLVFNDCTYSDGLFYNGYNGAIFNGSVCVGTADELIAAINAAKDGATIYLAAGDYALRFTNNTSFNVNKLTIKGLGEVNLAISSSEAWYGRVQGSNVTFENIHFTSSVGATGEATYNDCIFDSWAICASSNNEKTYFNNCTINGCLNTSTDFSSGNVYVQDCKIAKAEYSGSMTMNFKNCQIEEVIIWNSNTNFTNCKITTLNDDNVTSATVTIK